MSRKKSDLSQEASSYTASANQKVLTELSFGNTQDFIDASKGFIAPLPDNGIIKNQRGEIIWNLENYTFLDNQACPATVNPSLWRQAQLLRKSGLFYVASGIYQIRGADVSNMTIIEAQQTIIIVDTLLSIETAQVALALYYQHRPKKPISAVIYTHSHIDHFGGVKGIISQQDVDSGKIQVIAPEGFTQAAITENVFVGTVMARRATYMYGNLIPHGAKGQVTVGLGLETSSGTTSLILPTELIRKTGQKKIIDGIEFEFLCAPHSEAPAEMLFFLPQHKALCTAEDATHTMHNLYTLRGAKVRDARAWVSYLQQALDLFGERTETIFAQHLWPVWGNTDVTDFLEKQRDMYKYIHDQTIRLANHGYTMVEIGEMVNLPKSLAQEWYNQGYYGSQNHNAKAVYNFYLGWFDGNPATLHQLPPVEAAKKYVEYMGGADSIIEKAQLDYDNGNYRWVAQLLNHVVYAQPDNKKAKNLLAATLEQLAYQTQNGTWRNFYLTGAQELKQGIKQLPMPDISSPDILAAMPTDSLFDYLAIRLNGPKAADNPVKINLELQDTQEIFILQIKNGVLNYFKNKHTKNADATIVFDRRDFNKILLKESALSNLVDSKKIKIQGDPDALLTFLRLLDDVNFWFPIVEPK